VLLSRLAFLNNGGPKFGSEVFRKGVKLGIAINFDGLLGGIADDVAVVAPGKVLVELGLCRGVNDAV
jgi:hypothetical protein